MGILNIEKEIISEDSRIRQNSEVLHLVSDKKAEGLISWKPELIYFRA